MDIVAELLDLKRKVGQLLRRPAQIQPKPQIRKAKIIELGDYNVHRIEFTDGLFTEDLETFDMTIADRGETAYVGDELEFGLERFDSVVVALCEGRWWIIEAQQGCPSYCVDYPENQSYVYAWVLSAPGVSCCPEASGIHVMSTSDAGATYESATFQCNGSGTSRKWIFDGQTVRLSPMLETGNIQYRSDRQIDKCTVELYAYEPGIFPKSCGKFNESICLHPLCGVYSCSSCASAPDVYKASYNGGSANLLYDKTGFGNCSWKNYLETFESPSTPAITMSSSVPSLLFSTASYSLGVGESFDCWGENIFYADSPGDLDPGEPETVTVRPGSTLLIESLCYPLVFAPMTTTNTTAGDTVCTQRPYYVSFEVSGLANGTCSNCAVINNVFRTYYLSKFQNTSENTTTTCGNGIYFNWSLGTFTNSPSPSGVRLQCLSSGTVLATYEYLNPDEDLTTANCMSGALTLDYVSDNGECTSWPASITVYPII